MISNKDPKASNSEYQEEDRVEAAQRLEFPVNIIFLLFTQANVDANINLNRGFSRFRDYGIDPTDIHYLRILFHAAFITQHRNGIYFITNREHQLESGGNTIKGRELA